jgi:hypothetical protein
MRKVYYGKAKEDKVELKHDRRELEIILMIYGIYTSYLAWSLLDIEVQKKNAIFVYLKEHHHSALIWKACEM